MSLVHKQLDGLQYTPALIAWQPAHDAQHFQGGPIIAQRADELFCLEVDGRRQAGDLRPIPLGPDLMALLKPLVVGFRLGYQDEAPLFAEWSGDRLTPLSPERLRRLGAAVTGWQPDAVPEIGSYRHLYASRRKALEQWAKHRAPEAFVRHRRWSASLGHGQSGGWSIYLPNRLDAEIEALGAVDARWPLPRIASIPLRPPQLAQPGRRKPHTARRERRSQASRSRTAGRGSDWATTGLELRAAELDCLPAVHEHLWRFEWASGSALIVSGRWPSR